MRLSIVVPTFNRYHLLQESVPALLNQKVDETIEYEVIFVSNGSTDETRAYLEGVESQSDGRLRYFDIEATGGPSAPRNRGIREANSDIVIILDDDVLPDENLVQAYADHHRRFPAAEEVAIGEAYVAERQLSDPMSFFHEFPYRKIATETPISYIYFWTCNISFKRSFMLLHGMFDERFLYNEDIVCGYRLQQNGMKLRFCDRARGEHRHQGEVEELIAKGTFIGRWIWATVQSLPEPEIIDRYGVLSTRLPLDAWLKRAVNRLAFRVLDNFAIHGLLRALGAERGRRSGVSDLYYYLRFRSAIVAGYREARDEARRDGYSREQLRLLNDS